AVHVFFFSSRRRHTRFSRDWSSDVCSSDLTGDDAQDPRHRGDLALGVPLEGQRDLLGRDDLTHVALDAAARAVRVALLDAVLKTQHRPVVRRLVALVRAARLGAGQVVVAGEGVGGLVADVVVEVVGAVGDTRRRDHVVRVEQAVLVDAALADEGAAGGVLRRLGRRDVRLDALDVDVVAGHRAVAGLAAVSALALLALLLALLVLAAVRVAGLTALVAVVAAVPAGLLLRRGVARLAHLAGGEFVEALGAVAHAVDGGGDAGEGRGPLLRERAGDRVLREGRILPQGVGGLPDPLV